MLILLTAVILSFLPNSQSQCYDSDEVYHPAGDKWIRNGNFLVICEIDKIKVLKCISDEGNLIDVGSSHLENGIEYKCSEEKDEIEGSGEEEASSFEYSTQTLTPFRPISKTYDFMVNVNVCSEHFADHSDDLYKDRFVICCISRRFKGCLDDNGDFLKEGYFTIGTALKYCNIKKGGMTGRIEPRGCFNGTRDDDPSDATLHVKKYTTWRQGDKELRCGDNGIHVSKCYIPYTMPEGTGWIDKQGYVHVCK